MKKCGSSLHEECVSPSAICHRSFSVAMSSRVSLTFVSFGYVLNLSVLRSLTCLSELFARRLIATACDFKCAFLQKKYSSLTLGTVSGNCCVKIDEREYGTEGLQVDTTVVSLRGSFKRHHLERTQALPRMPPSAEVHHGDPSTWTGPKLKVIIAGGGIAGLVTGLQLHAIGIRDVDIFEATAKLTASGAGINLQPAAVLVLRDLGLLDALLATGIETGEQNTYDRFGNLIISEPRGHRAGYVMPQIAIHRGDLQTILLAAFKERLGADRIHLDHAISTFSPNGDSSSRITAHFVRRSEPHVPPQCPSCSSDLLIAADGINSAVRAQLYPNEGPPRFSGMMLWRGTMNRAPFLDGRTMVICGVPDQRFIAYPISHKAELRGESQVNWLADMRVQAPGTQIDSDHRNVDWTKEVRKERFGKAYDGWNFDFLDVPELIENTKEIYEFPMCDREPLKQWSFGKLTLIGDAAHPMYPMGSNGGTQAILDAKELAEQLLASTPDVEEALRNYEKIRLPMTASIVYANRGLGPIVVTKLAQERAPNGFSNVDKVISKEELEEIVSSYQTMSGTDLDSANKKAEESEGKSRAETALDES